MERAMANDAMTLQPSGARLSFDAYELDGRLGCAGHPVAARGNPRTHAERARDREFAAMSRLFTEHGGMATAEELVVSMRTCLAQPLSIVARWITQRAAVQMVWGSQTWFPWFQFARDPISIRVPVAEVVLALRDAFDDWEIALWFASCNEWLDHRFPIEVIGHDAAEVVRAARNDRFIARK
jgi:hypothetical protein